MHERFPNCDLASAAALWRGCRSVGKRLAALAVVLAGAVAQAAVYDWSGTASGDMSGTPANWGGTVPGAGDIARWNAASYTNAPTANAPLTIGQLLFDAGNTGGVLFDAGSGALTLNAVGGTGIQVNSGSGAIDTGGATFALGAAQSWTNDSASTLTLNGTIANGGNLLTVGGAGSTTLKGAISGAGGLAKEGSGVLNLTAVSSYTGGTTISAGTLRIGHPASLGDAAGGLTLAGGTLQTAGTWTARPVAVSGTASTLNVARNFATTVDGVISGTAADTLNKTGAGALYLRGGSTFSGNLVLGVDGGTTHLRGLDATATGTLASVAGITVNPGATLNLDSTGFNKIERVNDAAAITLKGGSLTLTTPNTAGSLVEAVGGLTLDAGMSTITASRGGTTMTVAGLSFGSLVSRSTGATANLVGVTGTLGAAGNSPRIIIGGQSDTSFLGGWARSGSDFVKYSTAVNTGYALGVQPLAGADYDTSNNPNSAPVTANMRFTAAPTALSGPTTVNSLVNAIAANTTYVMGNTLTLTSGGFIHTPANSLTISTGAITAGTGGAAELFMHVLQNTVTVGGNIIDNGAGVVTLVKDSPGILALTASSDNSYSGGSYVTGGTLTTGGTDGRTYLGSGAVTVDNAILTLGHRGATSNTVGPSYLARNTAQINIANLPFSDGSDENSFVIGAGAILAQSAAQTAGNGLNSLTYVSAFSANPDGEVRLDPGAMVGHYTFAAGTPLTINSLPNNADLFLALAANANNAGTTVSLGAGTPWGGLSTDRTARSFQQGTLTLNSDVTFQGFLPAGGTPVALTIGNNTTAPTLSAANPVTVHMANAVILNMANAGAKIPGTVTFDVLPGATLTLSRAATLGNAAGVLVQPGGTAAASVTDAINRPLTILPGGRFVASVAGGLTGSGALTFDEGAILEITGVTGFSGSQAAGAALPPGLTVRLGITGYGSAATTLDSLIPDDAVYVLAGTNLAAANPTVPGTPIMTLDGGTLTNDLTSRASTATANGHVAIGPAGATVAATTGTTLTLNEDFDLGANALAIGYAGSLDGNLKLGTVALGAGGHLVADTGTITVIPGATLQLAAAHAIPDLADLVVNGALNINALVDNVGRLSGAGTIHNSGNASTLTVGTDNSTTTFSGNFTATTAANLRIQKIGTGTWTLDGTTTSTATGTLAIQEGAVTLSGPSSTPIAFATTLVNAGGTLNIDKTGNNIGAHLNGKGLTLGGGTVNLTGHATAASAETTGALTIAAGASQLTVTPGAGQTATLTATSLAKSAGGVVLVRGDNLGDGTAAMVKFSGATTFVGQSGGEGAANRGIFPYALVNTSAAGSYTDAGTGFATLATAAGTGLRPLTGAEQVATLTINANVVATSGQTVAFGGLSVNSLDLGSGGGVTNGVALLPQTLTVQSGGIIARTGNTGISGGWLTAGANELIIHAMADLTIGSVMTGSGGLSKNGPGTLLLNARSARSGQVTVNAGILQLGPGLGANALYPNQAMVANGGTLELNGNSQWVGALSSTNPFTGGTITNGAGGAPVEFVTNGATNFGGTLSGNLNLTKSGSATMAVVKPLTYTGTTIINGGTLQLVNDGRLPETAQQVEVNYATLLLDNRGVQTDPNPSRISSSAPISVRGGGTIVINYQGAPAVQATQALGAVTSYGAITISVTAGGAGSAELTLDAFTRATDHSTVNFVGTPGTGGTALGTPGMSPRIVIAAGDGAANASNGIVGGWATVGNADFATVDATYGILSLPTAGRAAQVATASSTDNVRAAAAQTVLSSDRTINSLVVTGTYNHDLGGNALNILSGGLLKYGNTTYAMSNGSLTAGDSVADSDLYVFINQSTTTISASLVDNPGGAVNLVKSGAGALTLSGMNSYTGDTIVHAGTLTLNAGAAINGNLLTRGITRVNASNLIADTSTVTVNGNGAFALAVGVAETIGGLVIERSGGATPTTITLNAGSALTVDGGILVNDTNVAAVPIITGTGTLTLGGANPSVTVANATPFLEVENFRISTVITSGFEKLGAGSLTLASAASTFADGVTLTGGSLRFGASSTPTTVGAVVTSGPVGTGVLTLGDGTALQGDTAARTLANAVAVNGSFAFSGVAATNNLVLNGAVTLNASPTITVSSPNVTGTIGGAISGGANGITKAGSGVLVLSNPANVWTGTTAVAGGTLRLGAANAIPDASAVTVASEAVFNLNSFAETIGSLAGAGVVTNAGATARVLTVGADDSSTTFSGVLTASTPANLALTKVGAGVLTLSGRNTYAGATTISSGTLRIGAGGTAGTLGTGAVTNAGVLQFARADAHTVSNAISGGGQVVIGGVTGSDTQVVTFDTAKAYTGPTIVSSGTLNIATGGTINASSSISVQQGGVFRYNNAVNPLTTLVTITNGTIGGSGTIASALTIAANAILSPGNSPGSQTYGDMTWAGGGTYLWEINDVDAGAGTGWDLATVTGTFTLDATPANPFTIDMNSLTLANVIGNLHDATKVESDPPYYWKILDTGADLSGVFDADIFALDTSDFRNANGLHGFFGIQLGNGSFGGDNTELWVTYQVPEPASLLLALAGFGLLLMRRRRS